jgi:hypothetical protein
VIFFIADSIVQFKPFKITFQKPYLAVGTVLLLIAIFCFQRQAQIDTIKDVKKAIGKVVEKVITEKTKEQ